MRELRHLFDNNRAWQEKVLADDPLFFDQLSKQQSPKFLWIGCSDSRVPANQILGLAPGEVFVHRNVANLVLHCDFNCLSVIEFAVDVLKVEHIIVCGHYGCGGVHAAMQPSQLGLMNNWLRNVRDLHDKHYITLSKVKDDTERFDVFCEINVKEQVMNVCNTTIIQNAWSRKQKLSVHGWIYSISDGLLKDLEMCINSTEQLQQAYRVS